jgi:hypothetical protein
MTLIPAEQLKQTFKVEAKFYYSQVGEERFLMRREARISRIDTEQTDIDAVFVMINPGSCAPNGIVESFGAEEAQLIPAKPDPTQYQLMNLMERKAWHIVTLVNLSDICEGNMVEFISREKEFRKANVDHSLFQHGNKKELEELLASANHLIFAWGASDVAQKLARQFELFNNGKPTTSYLHAKALIDTKRKYPRHPRPATIANRIVWLDDMEPLL